jgi:hypothetical protein
MVVTVELMAKSSLSVQEMLRIRRLQNFDHYQVFFTQLNVTLDYSSLKLTLEFTLKCFYMFRLTNDHQGAYCCVLLKIDIKRSLLMSILMQI